MPSAPLLLMRRIVATVPDLVTMAVFALAWIDPRRFGLGLVVSLMVVMLLEFIVMHAGVVIGTVTQSRALERLRDALRAAHVAQDLEVGAPRL